MKTLNMLVPFMILLLVIGCRALVIEEEKEKEAAIQAAVQAVVVANEAVQKTQISVGKSLTGLGEETKVELRAEAHRLTLSLNEAKETLEAGDHKAAYSKAQAVSSRAESIQIATKTAKEVFQGVLSDFETVPIFYATDRQASGNTDPSKFYGNERDKSGSLQVGICEVSIPRDHKLGAFETPSYWKFEFRADPTKHVILQSVAPHPYDEYFTNLRNNVAASNEKAAFVFVQGYNVAFQDAARRTAQLAYDLHFDGAPILYSWPSVGQKTGYIFDETNVEWTIPHLNSFLTDIAKRSGAQTIHLIAHSMGNRALTRALQQIALLREGVTSPFIFGEVILTAPDIDAEVFKTLAAEIKRTAKRITLYASSKDEALILSKGFHGYQRAGDTEPSVVVLPEVDTIDVSAVDTSLSGHSYYGDNRTILADLFNLLRHHHPPSDRAGLRSRSLDGLKYWVFQP